MDVRRGDAFLRDVGGAFASGVRFAGASFSFAPEGPGAYTYYCEIHEHMRGLVVVQPQLS